MGGGCIHPYSGHRQRIAIADDEVIQHPHIDHSSAFCKRLVNCRSAWLGSLFPDGWLWQRISAAAL
jgi:hypothetical protein